MNPHDILDARESLTWDYDADADVLYLSIGSPRPAVSVDLGEGLIVRYDEVEDEVVGLTVTDLRARLSDELEGRNAGDAQHES